MARDRKGLYKKARAGEIRNFTGIDSPYEAAGSGRADAEDGRRRSGRTCGDGRRPSAQRRNRSVDTVPATVARDSLQFRNSLVTGNLTGNAPRPAICELHKSLVLQRILQSQLRQSRQITGNNREPCIRTRNKSAAKPGFFAPPRPQTRAVLRVRHTMCRARARGDLDMGGGHGAARFWQTWVTGREYFGEIITGTVDFVQFVLFVFRAIPNLTRGGRDPPAQLRRRTHRARTRAGAVKPRHGEA